MRSRTIVKCIDLASRKCIQRHIDNNNILTENIVNIESPGYSHDCYILWIKYTVYGRKK